MKEVPEITIELKSVPVMARSRKLKVKWTPDLKQDMDYCRYSYSDFISIITVNGKEYYNVACEDENIFELPLGRIICRLKKKK